MVVRGGRWIPPIDKDSRSFGLSRRHNRNEQNNEF
jgi:hypothetical protein